VETRDCLSAIEPRTVRAVMKRVVEDVAAMDVVIGQLYEEGTRTERTSDSTRRSYSFTIGRQGAASGPARSTWSITPRLVWLRELSYPTLGPVQCFDAVGWATRRASGL